MPSSEERRKIVAVSHLKQAALDLIPSLQPILQRKIPENFLQVINSNAPSGFGRDALSAIIKGQGRSQSMQERLKKTTVSERFELLNLVLGHLSKSTAHAGFSQKIYAPLRRLLETLDQGGVSYQQSAKVMGPVLFDPSYSSLESVQKQFITLFSEDKKINVENKYTFDVGVLKHEISSIKWFKLALLGSGTETIIDGEKVRLPKRISLIYNLLIKPELSLPEKYATVQSIAREAIEKPSRMQQDSSFEFYKKVLDLVLPDLASEQKLNASITASSGPQVSMPSSIVSSICTVSITASSTLTDSIRLDQHELQPSSNKLDTDIDELGPIHQEAAPQSHMAAIMRAQLMHVKAESAAAGTQDHRHQDDEAPPVSEDEDEAPPAWDADERPSFP
ncbi:MAG: hypothetical protein ACHP65_02520 [Legionellales bacterium]